MSSVVSEEKTSFDPNCELAKVGPEYILIRYCRISAPPSSAGGSHLKTEQDVPTRTLGTIPVGQVQYVRSKHRNAKTLLERQFHKVISMTTLTSEAFCYKYLSKM